MPEKIGNVRVFRVTFQDGHHAFEEKTQDGRGAIACNSIRGLAQGTRYTVRHMHAEGCSTVGIDFSPFHDIDCPSDLGPRLCSPLTEEERVEFWKHFFDED